MDIMVRDMANNKTIISQLFTNGEAYKNSLGLKTEITRCINMVEGRQWTNEDGTEDYPKIVLNQMKQINRVRKSGIMQNDYSFLVNTLKFEDTKKIQYFLKYLYKELKIKEKNLKVLDDNFKKGTSGLYFYWDAESMSTLSGEQGRLKAEVFDVRNLVVGNPSIQDIQEQPYIIYCTREKVGALKEIYKDKAKDIHSDGWYALSETQKEMVGINDDDEYTNVYNYFYRNKDYEVCYAIYTDTIELKGSTSYNPFNLDVETQEIYGTLSTSDVEKIKYGKEKGIFSKYPFAKLVMDERDNCFYGICGGYEYIEAQKSINAHFSTYDYAISQNVLGGFVYKNGVLGDQEITTDNAQMIGLELLPGEKVSDVFGRLPVNNLPNDAINYSTILSSALKSVSGATNVQMGQADYSNQTAEATKMLLERARENTSDYAMLYEGYMKDIAEVMFMFGKFYYDRKEFNIIEHGNEKDTNIEFTGEKAFRGNDYINEHVDFDIQVSPSASFNESILQQLAMTCVQTGNLKMMSVLKMLPYNTFPSFKELENELAKEDNTMNIIKMQEQKIQQYEEVMQQMSSEYKKMVDKNKTMDTVVQENLRLKEQMADVYAKSIEQAKESSKAVIQMQEEIKRMMEIINKKEKNIDNKKNK